MIKLAIPPSYFHVKAHRLIICTTPRVASSSMMRVLNLVPVISQENALSLREHGVDVIMWIRDPLERFACAYNLGMNRGRTFSQFVDWFRDNPNRHWIPQTDLHTYEGTFVPNVVLAFEDLGKTWPVDAVGILPHDRRSKNRPTWDDLTPHLTDDQYHIVLNFYEKDLELYYEHHNV